MNSLFYNSTKPGIICDLKHQDFLHSYGLRPSYFLNSIQTLDGFFCSSTDTMFILCKSRVYWESSYNISILIWIDSRFGVPVSFHSFFSLTGYGGSLGYLLVSVLAFSWSAMTVRWTGTSSLLRQNIHLEIWERKRTFCSKCTIWARRGVLSFFHRHIWASGFPFKWNSGFTNCCQIGSSKRKREYPYGYPSTCSRG